MTINWRARILGIKWIATQFAQINWRLEHIMATLEERFNAISTKLDEASSEILAEIDNLKKGGPLTPEQEAALETIEAKANALADIAPPLNP